MAQFNCKMCGGTIEVVDGITSIECEFCGTTQTIPTIINDSKLVALHNRANELRLNNEFDKALVTYENIINENPKDAEAHWGILLCRYGIEYVDDPVTKKKVPTCHRTQLKPIFEDIDYKAALECSDVVAQRIYQQEAEEINKLQKSILAISQNEKPFDIFICYKESDEAGKRTRDSVLAQQIYEELKARDYKVFFARVTLESKLGTQYEPYIFAALSSAKVMLVVGTKPEYYNAVWVKNEWARFLGMMNSSNARKYIIPCYRDMDAYNLPDELASFQAQDMNKLGFIQDLTRGIDKIFGRSEKKEVKPQVVTQTVIQNTINIQALLKRCEILLGDRDYEKASELLEDVLNNDPENAKAYILSLLIELELEKESDLVTLRQTLNDFGNYKKAITFADDKYRAVLEGYNREILETLNNEQKDIIYNKAIAAKNSKLYDQAITLFNDIPNYKDSKEQIAKCQEGINESIYKNALNLINNRKYQDAIEVLKIIENFKNSKELIKNCEELLIKQKDDNYNNALKLIENYKYTEAIVILQEMEDYKEAKEYIEKTKKLLNKENIYLSAVKYAKNNTIACYNSAIKKLTDIKDYRDSEALISNYQDKIKEIKNKQAIKKAKTKLAIKIISLILFILITATLLTTKLFIPMHKYNQAMDYIENGDLKSAKSILNTLDDFSDSSNQLQIIKAYDSFDDGDYETGIDYIYKIGGTINVSYDGNGGTPDYETSTIKKQRHIENEAVWRGYTFYGWVLEDYSINNEKDNYSATIKLKASWEPIYYKLTFNLNGGRHSNLPSKYCVESKVSIGAPTKTGYTFAGWEDTKTGVVTNDLVINEGTIGDKSYKALWIANQYTISFNANSGYLSTTSQTVTFDSKFTLPTPTRTGYKFLGWFYGSNEFQTGTWDLTKNVTLVAKWQAKEYKIIYEDIIINEGQIVVTFKDNYSTSTYYSLVTLEKGEILNYPTNPTRSGYVFTGWYKDAQCKTKFEFNETLHEDTTLYAGWTEMTLSNVYSESQIYPEQYTNGTPYTISTGSTSSSYKKHLYMVANESGNHYIYYSNSSSSSYYEYYFSIYNLTTNTSISNRYCYSTSYSSISFSCSKGDIIVISLYYDYYYSSTAYFYFTGFNSLPTSSATTDVLDGITYDEDSFTSTIVSYNSSYSLVNPTRTGYAFLGWYVGDTKFEEGTWNYDNNITLTPKWLPYSNVITYDVNGGDSLSTSKQYVTYDADYTLVTPTRTGYTFLGWYDRATKFESGKWNLTKDVNLVAKWQVNEYKITYDDTASDDGQITVTYDYNYSGTYNSSITLKTGNILSYPSKPNRSGYVFTGWYKDAQCKTKFEFNETLHDDTTLYAGWTEMSLTNVYSETQIYPENYSSSSSYYSISTGSTSLSYKKHLYMVANESGTHNIYYRNSTSSFSYKFYVTVYNLTTNTTILSDTACYSTSYTNISFSCNKGDIIVISLYYYSYSSTAYFYFIGFKSLLTSTATTDVVDGTVYKEDSTVTSKITYGSEYTLISQTRKGYTFLGWYNGETKFESGTWNLTKDVTLTPTWQVNTYKINYDVNGGSTLSSSTQSVNYDSSYTLSTPTRNGYTFIGWYIGSTKFESGTWNLTNDVTLVAKWQANEYKITYKDVDKVDASIKVTFNNNYLGATDTVVDVAHDAILNYPSKPTRSGYVFTGWYKDSECKNKFEFDEELEDDITLYAGWTEMSLDYVYLETQIYPEKYTSSSPYLISTSNTSSSSKKHLYMVANETGTHYIYHSNSSSSSSYKYYISIYNLTTKSTILSTTYYYSTSYNYNSFSCNEGDIIVISLYLYTYSSTVTFYFSGFGSLPASTASNEFIDIHYEKDNNITENVAYDSDVTLYTPIRTGYTFLGWYDGTTKYESGKWITGKDVMLTAKWQVNSYKITYDVNGGDTLTSTYQTVIFDNPYTLVTPTRTGYTFLGWYEGDTKYTSGTWPTDKDVTLTARWSANNDITYVVNHHLENIDGTGYETPIVENLTGVADSTITPKVNTYEGFTSPILQTVVIAPDGSLAIDYFYTRNSYTLTIVTNGAETVEPITQKYNSTFSLANPERENYTFGGWFTDINLSTAFTSTTIPRSNITLYAYWTEETKPSEFIYSGISTIVINSYTGTDTTVVVPEYIGGIEVTTIDTSAFANNITLTTLVLPNTVTNIGEGALAGCTALEEIITPVASGCDENVSNNSSYYTVTNSSSYPWSLSSGVLTSTNRSHSTSSEYFITANRNITISFSYKVSSESNCDIFTIYKNNASLLTVSGSYDYQSYSVTLNAGDTLKFRYSKDGSVNSGDDRAYVKDLTFSSMLFNFSALFGSDEIENTTDVTVNQLTFYVPNSLKKITIISDVIQTSAFENLTMLEEVNLIGVESIGQKAFKGCTSLVRINSTVDGVFNLPEELQTIGDFAFSDCTGLEQLNTNESLTTIGNNAFAGCTSLSMMNSTEDETLIISDGVTTIGNYAFMSASLVKNVEVPSSVTSIGLGAFKGLSNLESITLPFVGTSATASASTNAVFGYIFDYSSSSTDATTSQIYQSNTSYYYFIPQTIKNVTITDQSVIPYGAFSNCDFIETINLSENTTIIRSYAFYNCTNLSMINSSDESTYELPDGLLQIRSYVFYNCPAFKVIVPDTVTTIYDSAFRNCNSLESITLPFIGYTETTTTTYEYALGYIFGYTTSSNQYPTSNTSYSYTYQGYGNYVYYIPESLNEVIITKQTVIPSYSFYNCDLIASITLSDNTTSIGNYVFYNCTSLSMLNSTEESIYELPVDLLTIGNYAFNNCSSLVKLHTYKSLTTIGRNAFAGCTSLSMMNSTEDKTLIISDGVTTIGKYAFMSVSLVKNVEVPSSVTSIELGAFKGLNDLESITLPFVGASATDSESKSSVFGYIFDYSSSSVDNTITQKYTNSSSYYYFIPKTIKNVIITDQTVIPCGAFSNCNFIESIILSDDTTSIGTYAFYNCSSLEKLNSTNSGELVIPDSVTIIPSYCFYNCTSIIDIKVPATVTAINAYAFDNCTSVETFNSSVEKQIVIPESCQFIDSYAFRYMGYITEVIVNDTITTIGNGAFKGLNLLESITLPFVGNTINSTDSNLRTLGYIFGYTSNTNGGVTSDITYLYTYQGASYSFYIPLTLKEVIITKQTVIPACAFYNCDLIETVTLPTDVTSIGSNAFYKCSSLKYLNSSNSGEINIPDNVSKIESYTFYNCVSITDVVIPETITKIDSNAFSGCSYIKTFNSTNDYEAIIPESCQTIGSNAFKNMAFITDLTINDSIVSISSSAFAGFNSLENITLPFIGDSINSSSVFGYIFGTVPTTLKNVVITLDETIPSKAFEGCSNIKSITIPNSTKTIGSYVFNNCTNLSKLNSNKEGTVVIPSLVWRIEDYAFANCKSIKTVSLSKDITYIGANAFANCENVEKFNSSTLGELVTPKCCETIGQYAFQNMSLITDVVITDNVLSIGSGALKGVNSLETITLPFVGSTINDSNSYTMTFGHIFGSYNSTSGGTTSNTSYSYTYQGYSYSFYIPITLKDVTVTVQTSIPARAFYNCDLLENITLVNCIISEGSNAYYKCNANVTYTYEPRVSTSWNGSTIATSYNGGTGTQKDPYKIFNPAQFLYFIEEVNSGKDYQGVYFILTSDININNYTISMISSFSGNLNGNGHVIKNLYVTTTSGNYVGLFGNVSGTIENLGIENIRFTFTNTSSTIGAVYVGGFAGNLTGTLNNSYITGTVIATNIQLVYGGGFVGYNNGSINNCYSNCTVNLTSQQLQAFAAGFVGYNRGPIKNSFSCGNVTAKGYVYNYSFAAGFVGNIGENSSVVNCYYSSSCVITKYTTVESSYNNIGTCNSTENIVNEIKKVWDSKIWEYKYNLPTFL